MAFHPREPSLPETETDRAAAQMCMVSNVTFEIVHDWYLRRCNSKLNSGGTRMVSGKVMLYSH